MIVNRFGDEATGRISIVPITIPDLGEILNITRDENFTLFLPKHRRIAALLTNMFLSKYSFSSLRLRLIRHFRTIPKIITYSLLIFFFFFGIEEENIEQLLSLAIYCRDRVNPYLFNYSLTVALLHRPETKDLDLPSFVRCFPDKYVDTRVFTVAREQANILPDGSRVSI